MKKINIQSKQEQIVTQEQLNLLLKYLLNNKLDIEFPPTNDIVITPPKDMDADANGIIVKASGGKWKIDGSTDVSDNEFSNLKNFSEKEIYNCNLLGLSFLKYVRHFYKSGFYNTDGLVFMLDICDKCTAKTWTDLIGGVVFSGTNVSLTDGVPTFNGTYSKYSNSDSLVYNYGANTLEIVYKAATDDSTNNRCIFELKSGTVSYGALSNSRGVSPSNSEGVVFPYTTNATLTTASIIGPTSYFNKNAITGSGNNDWTRTSDNIIGSVHSNDEFIGKIYSIRMYDRILNEKEVLANQTIDLSRFGGL